MCHREQRDADTSSSALGKVSEDRGAGVSATVRRHRRLAFWLIAAKYPHPQPLVGASASPSVLRVISDDLPGTLSAQEGPPLTPDR